MRKMKSAVLLLAFAVVTTMAIPALGANSHIVKVNQIEGGGFINSTVMHNKSIFGFEALNNSVKVKGNLQYNDLGAHIKLHGNVTSLLINKTAKTATFSGMATVTNATGTKFVVPYTADVKAGKKGTGIFNITVPAINGFAGYTDNGTLIEGNIKIGPQHVHKAKINQTEGGGFINSTVMNNKSIFGFEAINNRATVRGNLEYIDHGAHIKLHGNVTMLLINKTARTATFSGMANVTNATGAKFSVPYSVDVKAGKKGSGIFNITIPAIGYTDNGTLLGGNIKVDQSLRD